MSELPSGLVIDARVIDNPLVVSKGIVVTDGDLRSQAMADPIALELVLEGVKFLAVSGDVVLVGCDYGRHRSVAVANAIAECVGVSAEHMSPGSNGKFRSVVV